MLAGAGNPQGSSIRAAVRRVGDQLDLDPIRILEYQYKEPEGGAEVDDLATIDAAALAESLFAKMIETVEIRRALRELL
jgi:hypothetical protein